MNWYTVYYAVYETITDPAMVITFVTLIASVLFFSVVLGEKIADKLNGRGL